MSNAYLPLVNRELAYARSQLQLLGTLPADAPEVQFRALLNAALLQLGEALGFYWREIAANYGLRQQPGTLQALLAALDAASLDAAEARELQGLRGTAGSWLANLEHWLRQRQPGDGAGPAAAVSPSPASAQIIAAVEVGEQVVDLTAEQLRECLEAMWELLERQRSAMVEY